MDVSGNTARDFDMIKDSFILFLSLSLSAPSLCINLTDRRRLMNLLLALWGWGGGEMGKWESTRQVSRRNEMKYALSIYHRLLAKSSADKGRLRCRQDHVWFKPKELHNYRTAGYQLLLLHC